MAAFLHENAQWIETVENTDLSQSSRKAWSIINRLTGNTKPLNPTSPVNDIAKCLINNGKHHNSSKEFTKYVNKKLKTAWLHYPRTLTSVWISHASCLWGLGKLLVQIICIQNSSSTSMVLLSLGSRNSTQSASKHQTFQRSSELTKIVPVLKPNKKPHDPKSYRPISLLSINLLSISLLSISLLSISNKILERLLYNRLYPILDPQFLTEQAGFRKGYSSVDKVALLTTDIENAFDARVKAGVVLVHLSTAYGTVDWPWSSLSVSQASRWFASFNRSYRCHFGLR